MGGANIPPHQQVPENPKGKKSKKKKEKKLVQPEPVKEVESSSDDDESFDEEELDKELGNELQELAQNNLKRNGESKKE